MRVVSCYPFIMRVVLGFVASDPLGKRVVSGLSEILLIPCHNPTRTPVAGPRISAPHLEKAMLDVFHFFVQQVFLYSSKKNNLDRR